MGIVAKSSAAGVQVQATQARTEQNARRANELADKINSLQQLLTKKFLWHFNE